jgi:tRNA threonylcarbamoyladenosine biosynthesis protein TsaE
VVRLVKLLSRSPGETATIGEAIGRLLAPGDVVALTGALGSGKSVLARGIMSGLGVSSRMPSPTFVIVATYEGTCAVNQVTVNHIDLYRMESAEEALGAGVEEALLSDAISIVEWAEKGQELLPPQRIDVGIALRAEPEERLLTIAPVGEDVGRRLLPLVLEWGQCLPGRVAGDRSAST